MGNNRAYLIIPLILLVLFIPGRVHAQSGPAPTELLGDEFEQWPTLPGSYPAGITYFEGERNLTLTQYVPGNLFPCGGAFVFEKSITDPYQNMSTWVRVGDFISDRSAWGADAYRVRFHVFSKSDVNIPHDLPAQVGVFLYIKDDGWGPATAASSYQGQRLDYAVTRTVKSIWVSTEPDVYEDVYYQFTEIEVELSATSLPFRGQPVFWIGLAGISYWETINWWEPWNQTSVEWGLGSIQIIPLLSANGQPWEPPPSMCTPPGNVIDAPPTPTPTASPTPSATPTGTIQPTNTPAPSVTPNGTIQPTNTPTRPSQFATAAPPPPPTVTPTPAIVRTVPAQPTATAMAVPTFAALNGPVLVFPEFMAATPRPGATPWINTILIATTPVSGTASGTITITGWVSQQTSSVYNMWVDPMATAESGIISGTNGLGGIMGTGSAMVSVVGESASMFQFIKALRWYMPNLWPLVFMMLFIFTLIMSHRLIKISVAVIGTAIEYLRRIWDAIPFKFS